MEMMRVGQFDTAGIPGTEFRMLKYTITVWTWVGGVYFFFT